MFYSFEGLTIQSERTPNVQVSCYAIKNQKGSRTETKTSNKISMQLSRPLDSGRLICKAASSLAAAIIVPEKDLRMAQFWHEKNIQLRVTNILPRTESYVLIDPFPLKNGQVY